MILKTVVFIKLLWVLLLFSTHLNSYEHLDKYDESKTYFPNKEWLKIDNPKKMGWSSKKLNNIKTFYKENFSNSVMIIENGVLVFSWGNLKKKYNLYSIRKSLLSATYGIYVDKGVIDLNETLKSLQITDIKALTETELSAKVSHLLKSRSGVYLPAAYETKSMERRRPTRGSYSPGEHFYYNNWDFNVLLSIFEKKTKKSFFKVFQNEIATPIGMEYFTLKDTRYKFERKKSIHPAYPFKMSALDLGRFGLLMLNEGKWDDKVIVSKEWLDKSFNRYTKLKKQFCDGYGFMWWRKGDKYCARGFGGQWLVMDPKSKIVIVHLVDVRNKKKKMSVKQFNNLINKIMSAKL